jgi:hypothetical protein
MGPDRDAGVVPTQVSSATGGDRDGVGLVTGAPALPDQADPPTLQLPTVPGGPERRAGGSRDDRRRHPERRQQGRDRREQARDRRRLEQEREQQEQERERQERERRRRERKARSHRGLKRAIWAAAAALILAVGALVATEVHTWHVFSSGTAAPGSADQHPSQAAAPAALKPVSVQDYSAAYEVTASSFSVTVSTDRPTWVEGRAGSTGPTLYAGELPAGSSKQLSVSSGPLWLQVGAGGSTLVVRTGGKVIGTLRPLLAPWQVTFTPTGTPTG